MSQPSVFAAESQRQLVLADGIRASGIVWMDMGRGGEPLDFPRKNFAGCTPVVLDAVSDWWDAQGAEKWPDDRLQPNYRLPWPAVWAEWEDKNDRIISESRDAGYAGRGLRKGLLIREHEVPDGRSAIDVARAMAAQFGLSLDQSWKQAIAAWSETRMQTAQLFHYVPHLGRYAALPKVAYPVRADGGSLDSEMGGYPFMVLSLHPQHVLNQLGQAIWNELGMWRLFTALLAVRNIGVADVKLPRAARRRAERQALEDGGPPPWVEYKTLALTLPNARREGSARPADAAAPIPFHLVRGHLADYRQGPGLFGKWKTVVWVPMHSRGFQRVGAIAKSYAASIDVEADPSSEDRS